MSDPVEWLTAELDEVEETAKAAERDAGSPWRTEGNYRDVPDIVVASTPLPGYTRPTYWLWNSEEDVYGSSAVAAHVAGMDPAMVLQLVAATRQLLELHRLEWNHDYAIVAADGYVTGFSNKPTRSWPVCSDCGTGDPFTPEDWPCPTMRAVAVGWGWVDE